MPEAYIAWKVSASVQGDTAEDARAFLSIAAMGEKWTVISHFQVGCVWYHAQVLNISACRFRVPLLRELLLIVTSSENSVCEEICRSKV